MKNALAVIPLLIVILGSYLTLGLGHGLDGWAGTVQLPSTNSLVLNFDFPFPTMTENSGYYHVSVGELPSQGEPGEPVLPFELVRVLIPEGKEATNVKVKTGEGALMKGDYLVEYGKTVLPLSSHDSIDNCPNEKTYSSKDPIPDELFSIVSKQFLRGYEILLLELYPVRYIPKTSELTYFEKMTLTINLKDKKDVSPFSRNLLKDRLLVQDLVDNPDEAATYARAETTPKNMEVAGVTDPYEYVIVTGNQLALQFQPLVDWKNSHGTTATMIFVEDIMKDPRYNSDGLYGDGNGSPKFNDTQAHIRNFIKSAYSNLGTQYVLLGGDDGIIPARGIYDYAGNYTDYNIPSDIYYGALDGSWDSDNDTIFGETVYPWNGPENGTAGEEADFFAEVYIGRAPVNTPTQAANFVSKTIAYEHASAENYLSKALFVGQTLDDVTEGGNGEDLITDLVPQYTKTRLYDRDGTYSKAAVINELNSGTHIVNHDGHSNYRQVMGLTAIDVNALTNTQYFMIYSIGCFSAAFDTAVSGSSGAIAENFLTGPNGAFAYIGNSRYGWYCPASDDGPGERYDRAFVSILNSGVRNLGKALQLSKEQEPLLDRWTYFTLNLLGDPETEIVTSLKTPTAHFQVRTDLLNPPHIGGIINLKGKATRGTATEAAFNNFTIEFGNGTNPTSWVSNGITLEGNGHEEVTDGALGTWNTSEVTDGTYTLRLKVYGTSLVGTDKRIVVVSKQAATVYIEENGTIYPPSAPIHRDGNLYTLTGNIISDGDGIIIERDGITLDGFGHTVQGSSSGAGIFLKGRNSVTVENVSVTAHLYGIFLEESSNNIVFSSSTNNNRFGIWLLNSSGNDIFGNEAASNYYGIGLVSNSENNLIVGNTIRDSAGAYAAAIYLYISSHNSIYHNSFINNAIQQNSQIYDATWDCADPGLIAPSINTWDNGYPSGGNHWTDYGSNDNFKGIYQNETGSDNIGDVPYVIDSSFSVTLNNKDKYPVMNMLIHDILITRLATSKTIVGTGYTVVISTWIGNSGGFTETFNVTVSATHFAFETIAVFNNVTVASLDITSVEWTWNVTGLPLGNYTIGAFASAVPCENGTLNNNFTGCFVIVSIIGDITGADGWPDGRVDMRDIGSAARLFGVRYPDSMYDPNFDIAYDLRINMMDIGIMARHFGDITP